MVIFSNNYCVGPDFEEVIIHQNYSATYLAPYLVNLIKLLLKLYSNHQLWLFLRSFFLISITISVLSIAIFVVFAIVTIFIFLFLRIRHWGFRLKIRAGFILILLVMNYEAVKWEDLQHGVMILILYFFVSWNWKVNFFSWLMFRYLSIFF